MTNNFNQGITQILPLILIIIFLAALAAVAAAIQFRTAFESHATGGTSCQAACSSAACTSYLPANVCSNRTLCLSTCNGVKLPNSR